MEKVIHRNRRTMLKPLWILLLVSFASPVWGDNLPRVLIFNSDATIAKYRAPEEAFRKAVPFPVLSIDLSQERRLQHIESLINSNPSSLIYCIGSKAYMSIQPLDCHEYIIFSSILNASRLPQGPRTYGIANELNPTMQLTLFHYIFPDIHKIGVLFSEEYNQEWLEGTQKSADILKIQIIEQAVSSSNRTISSLKALLPKIDALWLIADPITVSDTERLLALLAACDAAKVPVLSYNNIFAELGATLTISVDDQTIGYQAADIAKQILGDEKVDTRVQFPAGSHIILNLAKVKAYALKYNQDALHVVNATIE